MDKVLLFTVGGIVGFAFIAIVYMISGCIFQFAWNGFVTKLFTQAPHLDYWTAVAGSVILSMMTGSLKGMISAVIKQGESK